MHWSMGCRDDTSKDLTKACTGELLLFWNALAGQVQALSGLLEEVLSEGTGKPNWQPMADTREPCQAQRNLSANNKPYGGVFKPLLWVVYAADINTRY